MNYLPHPPEGGVVFFYYEEQNLMFDEDGFPVFNIFEYITPNEFFIFKTNKEYMIIIEPNRPVIELIYPEHDDDYS